VSKSASRAIRAGQLLWHEPATPQADGSYQWQASIFFIESPRFSAVLCRSLFRRLLSVREPIGPKTEAGPSNYLDEGRPSRQGNAKLIAIS
jgi:hypothetical protein